MQCSIFEQDEDHQGWVAGKRDAFFEPCAREVGKTLLNTEDQDNGVVLKETKEQRTEFSPGPLTKSHFSLVKSFWPN